MLESAAVAEKLPGQKGVTKKMMMKKKRKKKNVIFWHFWHFIKITLRLRLATFLCLCIHSVEDSTLIFCFFLLHKGRQNSALIATVKTSVGSTCFNSWLRCYRLVLFHLGRNLKLGKVGRGTPIRNPGYTNAIKC